MFTPVRLRLTSCGYSWDSGCDWTWARAGRENIDTVIITGNKIEKEIKNPHGFDNLILVRLSKVLAVTIFSCFVIFKAIVEQSCGSLIR